MDADWLKEQHPLYKQRAPEWRRNERPPAAVENLVDWVARQSSRGRRGDYSSTSAVAGNTAAIAGSGGVPVR